MSKVYGNSTEAAFHTFACGCSVHDACLHIYKCASFMVLILLPTDKCIITSCQTDDRSLVLEIDFLSKLSG